MLSVSLVPVLDMYLFGEEPTELLGINLETKLNQIPAKSRKCYEKAYREFLNWCTEKTLSITQGLTEDALLDYFGDKSQRYKPSSLWCYYSMLKTTIKLNDTVDIGEYPKLLAFLRQTCEGYAPTKSKFLTKQEVETFLIEAPDDIYLFLKVALIFGICGACKREELAKLETNDIQDLETSLLISIKETKTKIDRMFMVVDGKPSLPSFIGLYRKYLALRPGHTEHNRFFVYYKNNKCTAQVVGKNTFGEIPRKIAGYLNLPDAHRFSGHCFRRTSATMHAEAEENLKNANIKMYGGW